MRYFRVSLCYDGSDAVVMMDVERLPRYFGKRSLHGPCANRIHRRRNTDMYLIQEKTEHSCRLHEYKLSKLENLVVM